MKVLFQRKRNSNESIQKYISIYMKKWSLLWLLCATVCAVPIFVLSLQYDNISYDMFISIIPYAIAALLIIINRLLAIRFSETVQKQEKLYSVRFFDSNAERIADKVYLSDDWIIFLGKCALYKQPITDITFYEMHSPKLHTHEVIFQTQNDAAYTFWIESKEGVEKVKKWLEK